jgi:uncharacterized protein (DUF1499 family)
MRDTQQNSARKRWSWTALLGLALGSGAIVGIAVSGIGYRLGWWQVVAALSVAEYAAYAAGFGLVLSAIGLLIARPGSARRGFLAASVGLAASLPIVAMAINWEYATRIYPPINDISTDSEDPPVFWDMPNPTEYPGGRTADLQREAYPDLAPLTVNMDPERVFVHARAVVEDSGWRIVAEEPEEGRIEAVDTTLFYGFKDEVVVRVTPSADGTVVDIRSRSRIGRIDRGVNAMRIRTFLADLEERIGNDKPL